MKRSLVVAILVLAFLLMAAMKLDDTTPLGVNVQIAPSTRDEYQLLRRATPDTYTARASVYAVSDPKRVIAADIVVSPGHSETETVTVEGLEVSFTVGVSKGSDRAKTEVIAKRGQKIVLDQRSQIELRPPGRAIVPLQ